MAVQFAYIGLYRYIYLFIHLYIYINMQLHKCIDVVLYYYNSIMCKIL